MAINTDKLKQAQLPNLNRPQPNPEAYHQQNEDAISTALTHGTQQAKSSLQRLDNQLTVFERRYARAAVTRVKQVPQRIVREMALMLQEEAMNQCGFDVSQAIEAIDVPSFELPPAITPVMGALSM